MKEVKLTEYSHGSGCGCKISPEILDNILNGLKTDTEFPDLIIGNDQKDDAAVVSIDDDRAIISTTDFFMPIVDDPFDFGRIAATNALSDIYAMGGKPLMAVSIFGWPIDKLSEEVGRLVIKGGQQVCEEAGIPLAGGHSIDSPEPIFGLAVTGIVNKKYLKANSGAHPGDLIYLTKPLGIGVFTTAEKRKILDQADDGKATKWMLQSNSVGTLLGELDGVSAITDVTGFGLLGHLSEVCEASKLSAEIEFSKVPIIGGIEQYLEKNSVPGGTEKNYRTYNSLLSNLTDNQKNILFDPQTSGGLLVTVNPASASQVEELFKNNNILVACIGRMTSMNKPLISIN